MHHMLNNTFRGATGLPGRSSSSATLLDQTVNDKSSTVPPNYRRPSVEDWSSPARGKAATPVRTARPQAQDPERHQMARTQASVPPMVPQAPASRSQARSQAFFARLGLEPTPAKATPQVWTQATRVTPVVRQPPPRFQARSQVITRLGQETPAKVIPQKRSEAFFARLGMEPPPAKVAPQAVSQARVTPAVRQAPARFQARTQAISRPGQDAPAKVVSTKLSEAFFARLGLEPPVKATPSVDPQTRANTTWRERASVRADDRRAALVSEVYRPQTVARPSAAQTRVAAPAVLPTRPVSGSSSRSSSRPSSGLWSASRPGSGNSSRSSVPAVHRESSWTLPVEQEPQSVDVAERVRKGRSEGVSCPPRRQYPARAPAMPRSQELTRPRTRPAAAVDLVQRKVTKDSGNLRSALRKGPSKVAKPVVRFNNDIQVQVFRGHLEETADPDIWMEIAQESAPAPVSRWVRGGLRT